MFNQYQPHATSTSIVTVIDGADDKYNKTVKNILKLEYYDSLSYESAMLKTPLDIEGMSASTISLSVLLIVYKKGMIRFNVPANVAANAPMKK